MAFLDRFIDTEKTSKVEVRNPRDIYYDILKGTSGTNATRESGLTVFYTTYGFKGITEGVGCSTLVANTARAIADMGLTVCVIDTSILNPVQDILLKTDVEYESAATYDANVADKRLDWFDMPYTRKSVLHVSKLNSGISVLSFKGKLHTIVDFLSTSDSEQLVEMALSELHTKFDIILIDICHEPSSIATACLQQSQKIIQIWNDAPTVLGNLERFLTNQVLLACPMDKMSYVVYSKIQKDAMGTLDNILKEYKFKKLGINYLSEEIALQTVVGNDLFQLPSNDPNVIAFTDCVVDIACMILNLTEEREEAKLTQGKKKKKKEEIIKTEDILAGNVDGTVTKKLKDREHKIRQDLGIESVKTLADADKSLEEDFVDVYKEQGMVSSVDEFMGKLEDVEDTDDTYVPYVPKKPGETETDDYVVKEHDNIDFTDLDEISESEAEALEAEAENHEIMGGYDAEADDADIDFEATSEEPDNDTEDDVDIDFEAVDNAEDDTDIDFEAKSDESIEENTEDDADMDFEATSEEPIDDTEDDVDMDFEATSDESIEEDLSIEDDEDFEIIDLNESEKVVAEEPVENTDYEETTDDFFESDDESSGNSEQLGTDEGDFFESDEEFTGNNEPVDSDDNNFFESDTDSTGNNVESGNDEGDFFESDMESSGNSGKTGNDDDFFESDMESSGNSDTAVNSSDDSEITDTDFAEEDENTILEKLFNTEDEGIDSSDTNSKEEDIYDIFNESSRITEDSDSEEFFEDNSNEYDVDSINENESEDSDWFDGNTDEFEGYADGEADLNGFEDGVGYDNDDSTSTLTDSDDAFTDEEFIDEDDEFIDEDEDETFAAVDSYVKAQNTEF